MDSDYLMYAATILYLVCYVPELYANYINKNANIYNIPEKIIMLSAASLAFSYSIVTNNNALIINYGPTVALDIIALLMRVYYAYWVPNGGPVPEAEVGIDDYDLC
jgi:uncharacterized protein with PQ loop repeat